MFEDVEKLFNITSEKRTKPSEADCAAYRKYEHTKLLLI